jgi:hypothetical protein
MRLLLLTLAVAATTGCQTSNRESTVKTTNSGDAGTPCELDIALNCPEGQHDGCLTQTTAVHKCVEGEVYTGEEEGIDCALEIALDCGDDEVDGCLTGQSTVHRCVSDGTTTTPSGIRTVKLYDQPQAFAEPSCDRYTEMKLGKTHVTLTNRLAGTCELAIMPNERKFEVTKSADGCGTTIYKGKAGERTIVVQDNTRRTCDDVRPARITVEVTEGATTQYLYSE